MRHQFFFDTAELRLSHRSETLIRRFHLRRSERMHRTLFPFLVAVTLIVLWIAVRTFN
jgi:hypothetical protein